MREMKDSGVPWIGKIPKGWALLRTKNQYRSRKSIAGDAASQYERLALTLGGVIKRSKDDSTGLQPESFEGYQVLQEGELVFKLIDLENLATSRIGFSPYTGIVSPAYVILHPNEGVNARYGEYYFLSLWHRAIFNSLGDNGVRSNLNAGDLLGIPYVVPPIQEQNRIVYFLDTKCAEIDSILEKTQASIEEYKKLKLSVITEAVTKGVRDERTMKDSGEEWIGEIPAEWKLSRVGLHFGIILGKMLCSEPLAEDYTLEKYYCAANVHFTGVDNYDLKTMWFSPSEKEAFLVKKGDLLVVEGGAGAGGSAIVKNLSEKIYIQNSIMIVRPKVQSSAVYLRYVLESLVTRGYVDFACNKATIPHFTKDKLGQVPFPLPEAAEQQEIAAYLDEKCAAIDSLIASKETLIAELEAYKKSLIYEYVTGKKEVL